MDEEIVFRDVQRAERANQLFRNYEDKNGNTAWKKLYDTFNPKRRQRASQLSPAWTTVFRSCVMRANFLSRSCRLGKAEKGLARHMSKPSRRSMEDIKRSGRSSLGKELRYEDKRMPDSIGNSVDSDFPSERTTRKSTTGMVRCLGRYTVRTTANLQTSVGVNVCECDFYALVYGATHGLRLQAYLQNIGVKLPWSWSQTGQVPNPSRADEYRARSDMFRKRYLRTQDMFAANRVEIRQIPTTSATSC